MGLIGLILAASALDASTVSPRHVDLGEPCQQAVDNEHLLGSWQDGNVKQMLELGILLFDGLYDGNPVKVAYTCKGAPSVVTQISITRVVPSASFARAAFAQEGAKWTRILGNACRSTSAWSQQERERLPQAYFPADWYALSFYRWGADREVVVLAQQAAIADQVEIVVSLSKPVPDLTTGDSAPCNTIGPSNKSLERSRER